MRLEYALMVTLLASEEQVTPLKLRVGKRIAQLRKAAKLSQTELGSVCGVSSSYFGHVERGARLPARDVLKRAAVLLDVDSDELLELAEYIEPRQGDRPIFAPPDKDPILRQMLRYPVERLRDAERWLRISSTQPVPPQDYTTDIPEDEAERPADPEKPQANLEGPSSR